MPFITKSGETRPLDLDWNGVKSCPDFAIRDGQTFGEAAPFSGCNCEFCCICRSEDAAEDPGSSESFPTGRNLQFRPT